MEIRIDTAAPTPVYLQIIQQITHWILSGALTGGDSLPPIRQLADDLELNPNTVAKAYKHLENSKIIQTAGRKGTFIRADAAQKAEHGMHQAAAFQLKSLLTSFSEQGLSRSDLSALLKDQLKDL